GDASNAAGLRYRLRRSPAVSAIPGTRNAEGSGMPAPPAGVSVRAEFPPAGYWRRWCEDAAPAEPVRIDAPPAEPPPPAVTPPPPAVTPPPAADGTAEAPYRVLVVEDDLSQALFAESVLCGAGMQAAVVSVAGEVMGSLEAFRPDLVLMDLHMPGMDGVELTNLIRDHETHGHVPIVFLTGDPDPERQFEALETGADDFLTKPV